MYLHVRGFVYSPSMYAVCAHTCNTHTCIEHIWSDNIVAFVDTRHTHREILCVWSTISSFCGLFNLYVLSSYESTVYTYINGHHDLFIIPSCTYNGYTDLGLTTNVHIFSVIIVMYTCSPINPTIHASIPVHSTCFCIHHMHASIMNLYNVFIYIDIYRVCCMVHCQVVTACMNYL